MMMTVGVWRLDWCMPSTDSLMRAAWSMCVVGKSVADSCDLLTSVESLDHEARKQ